MNINSDNKNYKLIKIYDNVCEKFEEHLQFQCERFSNNNQPKLTYQELITIYLFVMNPQGIFKLNKIYQFAVDYLSSWIPDLGNYQAFNTRMNRLSNMMNILVAMLLVEYPPKQCSSKFSVLDSMPIITCSGKRSASVATKITDKGYCSTKSMYYYGVKLHAIGFCNPNKLPYPEQMIVTKASVSDFTVFKEAWSEKVNRIFFGDKMYNGQNFLTDMNNKFNSEMLTPVKAIKETPDVLKKFDKTVDYLINLVLFFKPHYLIDSF